MKSDEFVDEQVKYKQIQSDYNKGGARQYNYQSVETVFDGEDFGGGFDHNSGGHVHDSNSRHRRRRKCFDIGDTSRSGKKKVRWAIRAFQFAQSVFVYFVRVVVYRL